MTIRRMRQSDYAAYCALLRELHALHYAARPDIYQPEAALPDEKEFGAMLESSDCFVSEDESGVTGMAVMRLRTYENPSVKKHTVAWIEDLCVREDRRGQGAGRSLYEALLARAREEGVERIELNVFGFNEPARAFYEHMGLTERSRVMEAWVK